MLPSHNPVIPQADARDPRHPAWQQLRAHSDTLAMQALASTTTFPVVAVRAAGRPSARMMPVPCQALQQCVVGRVAVGARFGTERRGLGLSSSGAGAARGRTVAVHAKKDSKPSAADSAAAAAAAAEAEAAAEAAEAAESAADAAADAGVDVEADSTARSTSLSEFDVPAPRDASELLPEAGGLFTTSTRTRPTLNLLPLSSLCSYEHSRTRTLKVSHAPISVEWLALRPSHEEGEEEGATMFTSAVGYVQEAVAGGLLREPLGLR